MVCAEQLGLTVICLTSGTKLMCHTAVLTTNLCISPLKAGRINDWYSCSIHQTWNAWSWEMGDLFSVLSWKLNPTLHLTFFHWIRFYSRLGLGINPHANKSTSRGWVAKSKHSETSKYSRKDRLNKLQEHNSDTFMTNKVHFGRCTRVRHWQELTKNTNSDVRRGTKEEDEQ